MNGQRAKSLKRKFIELYGTITEDNIKLYRNFKRVFRKNTPVNQITKIMFERRIT